MVEVVIPEIVEPEVVNRPDIVTHHASSEVDLYMDFYNTILPCRGGTL